MGDDPSDLTGAHSPDVVPTSPAFLLPDLAQLPGHLMWRAHARVAALLGMDPEVDLHSYAVLLALTGDRPLTQQEVADRTALSRTTMVKVAADLAAVGLVERVRNPADRRSYALTPTPAGARAREAAEPRVDRLDQHVNACLPPHDAAELRGLLQTIARRELSDDVPAQLMHRIGFLVSKLHLRMHRDCVLRLEPLRIEPRAFGTLTALRSLGPVPQAELARTMGVSGPHMVTIVDELEARGLVERRRSTTDRRTHLLHLLPEAVAVLDQATTVVREGVDAWFAPLDADQVERLCQLLVRFVTA